MLVASNYLNVISIRFATPVAIDEVEVTYAYFAHQDDDDAMVLHRIRQSSNAIGPSGLISMEDASVFHRVQIGHRTPGRSEEHTSELQSLMRISYAVFCLKKKKYQLQQPRRLRHTIL